MNFIEKIIEKLALGFNFSNRSNSPSVIQKISESSTGDVIGRDKNVFQEFNTKPSNLEKMALKVLYKEYKSSGLNYLKLERVYKELEMKIEGGQYVGILNNSKYIKLDGDEYYITDEGIRYMDNANSTDETLLPSEQREKDRRRKCAVELQKKKMDERARDSWKNSCK